jgi:hypothetical protein
LSLESDQLFDPLQVAFGRLSAVFDQRSGIRIVGRAAFAGGSRGEGSASPGQLLDEMGAPPLQQVKAGLGREVTAKGEAQGEGAVLVGTGTCVGGQ